MGTIGRGIAQVAATAGMQVLLCDQDPERAQEARRSIAALPRTAGRQGIASGRRRRGHPATRAAGARLGRPVRLRARGGIDRGGSHAKQELLAALESVVGPACILATNTSSLSVTRVAAGCRRPGRVAGWHLFNPVPLMRVVEVVAGDRTETDVAQRLWELSRAWGNAPVRADDTPGFIVNHAGRAFSPEALRIVSEGIAGFADVDG